MPLERTVWDGTQWLLWQDAEGPSVPRFTPGVTMPEYVPTSNFTGAKNVGNLPGVTLTPYQGTLVGNGSLVQIPAGTYNNIDFGDRRLDVRGAVTMNNCRVTLTSANWGTTSIPAVVQRLNGTNPPGLLTMNDCEIHNRAQRLMNGFLGRHAVFNRCVSTGGVDGLNPSASGGLDQSFGLRFYDCWLGDHAWWYYPTTGVVHASDTQTHNDSSQVLDANGIEFHNCFFGCWPSEYVGTGTPGSGSETNPYVVTYITNQATMNGWRASFLNRITRADQSFQGIPRKTSTGGSWACIMGQRANGLADHCWFSGGGVQVNLSDNALPAATNWTIKRSTFWNDMGLGHSLTTTAKGTAIYLFTGYTYNVPTSGPDRNVWFDGTTVIPTYL
jgi:hypothetical protein